MALIGISLLVASVVYVVIRPPTWLPRRLATWFSRLLAAPNQSRSSTDADIPTISEPREHGEIDTPAMAPSTPPSKPRQAANPVVPDIQLMPPPPRPSPPAPTIEEPESPTTPKALVAPASAMPPPSFTISPDKPTSMRPPPRPEQPSTMPPPPKPPTLAQFPAANSAQRARGPVPNRGPSGGLAPAGLAPPPTHSSKPNKPSRQVTLDPGHSPLDWARISGPNADLRGVDPSSPYLRVTPSMLKIMTGRKGKDAWMALNGKVYNVTPYAAFHPGGIPELMRGAGRDGSKLFGEVHPWVNYETMLSACLIGLLVEEPTDANVLSEMDEMD